MCVCVCVCVCVKVEELVPEAEEGGRMVEQLEHHLQSSQQQLETLQKEKDNMEQNVCHIMKVKVK